jgi:hypothetical protein
MLPPPGQKLTVLGASSVATILGVPGPTGKFWSSPISIWARVLGLVEPEPDNAAIRTGRMFEHAICARYAEEQGVRIRPGPLYEEAPVIGAEPWMGCRPDRYIHESATPMEAYYRPQDPTCDWLLEAKKTRTFHHGSTPIDTWGSEDTESVPLQYFIQVHWQLVVCSHKNPTLNRADLAAFAPSSEDFRTWKIKKNERIEKGLVNRARDWWNEYVVGKKQPPVQDGSEITMKTLARLTVAGVTPTMREPDATDLALARDLYRLRHEAAEIEARASAVQAKIMERIGSDKGIAKIATWGTVAGRRTLDRERMEKDHPSLVQSYLKVGEPTRRFSFNFNEE